MQRVAQKTWSTSLVAAALVAVVLTAVAFISCRTAFEAAYAVNDDIGMQMRARGVGVCDRPTPFLCFSHYLYGRLLVALYGLADDINWYRLLSEGICFLSTATICFSILRRRLRPLTIALLTVYLLTFSLYFYRNPQFTVTAFLAGQAGVFLYLGGLGNHERLSIATLMLSLFLVCAGTLFSEESVQLVLLLSVPLLLSQLVGRPKAATFARIALFLGLSSSLSLLATAYNRLHYSRAGGRDQFFAFNSLRAEFTDYHRAKYGPETKPNFGRVGWSKNDYDMLTHYFFADSERYSIEKKQTVLDTCRDRSFDLVGRLMRRTPERARVEVAQTGNLPTSPESARRSALDRAVRLLKHRDFLFMLGAILVGLFYVRWDSRRLLCLSLTLLAVAAVCGYLVLWKKLPPRVFFPMLAFVNVAALFATSETRPISEQRWRTALLKAAPIVIFAAVLPLQLYHHYADSVQFRSLNDKLLKSMDLLDPQPSQLFVVWGGSFPYQLISPSDNLDFMTPFKLVAVGWGLRTPVTQERLAEFGITDLYRGLYEKDNVCLIADDSQLSLLFRYVYEHYGVRLTAKRVVAVAIGGREDAPTGPAKDQFRKLCVYKLHPTESQPEHD